MNDVPETGMAAAAGTAGTAGLAGGAGSLGAAGPAGAQAAAPSVLHQLNGANQRLELLLQNLRNERHAEQELRDIARAVAGAVESHPDIALACIFLSQIAGTYAVRHCIETAVVVVVVARGMGWGAGRTLAVTAAALTMNVGMLGQHESFQNKHALTREEQAIVHRHPADSADLLKYAGVEDEEWISCVLLHHENEDGSGYPAGIASPQVTENAKLLSLADRYCAQVSARNYRRSVLSDQALRKLREDRGAPVDPHLLDHFQRELGDYPPGCLVRLHNGETGVVSARAAGGAALQAHSLRAADGALLTPPEPRDTAIPAHAIATALSEDEAAVRFGMKQVWGAQASL